MDAFSNSLCLLVSRYCSKLNQPITFPDFRPSDDVSFSRSLSFSVILNPAASNKQSVGQFHCVSWPNTFEMEKRLKRRQFKTKKDDGSHWNDRKNRSFSLLCLYFLFICLLIHTWSHLPTDPRFEYFRLKKASKRRWRLVDLLFESPALIDSYGLSSLSSSAVRYSFFLHQVKHHCFFFLFII